MTHVSADRRFAAGDLSATSGTINTMGDELTIDVRGVCGAVEHVCAAADGLVSTAHRLKMRPPAPAPDVVSLRIAGHARDSQTRIAQELSAAADELTRAGEAILRYAGNMADAALWGQLGIMGLDVSPLSVDERLHTPTRVFDLPPRNETADLPRTGHELLGWAVLVANGCQPSGVQITVEGLSAAGGDVSAGAKLCEEAMSSGARPAAYLRRVREWISTEAAPAVERWRQTLEEWGRAYAYCRAAVTDPAQNHVRWLAKAVSSQAQGFDTPAAGDIDVVRHALVRYQQTSVAAYPMAPFPRLG